MSAYETMRHFADSWGLIGMMAVFIIAVVALLRPGARKRAQDASQIPFKDYSGEDK